MLQVEECLTYAGTQHFLWYWGSAFEPWHIGEVNSDGIELNSCILCFGVICDVLYCWQMRCLRHCNMPIYSAKACSAPIRVQFCGWDWSSNTENGHFPPRAVQYLAFIISQCSVLARTLSAKAQTPMLLISRPTRGSFEVLWRDLFNLHFSAQTISTLLLWPVEGPLPIRGTRNMFVRTPLTTTWDHPVLN